jgi:hypothetical protein
VDLGEEVLDLPQMPVRLSNEIEKQVVTGYA